jgi:hypothetical protein
MNSNAVAILSSPQPCGHIVFPYTDESQVAEAVCLFTSSGLTKGEAVLLVMTQAHCEPILERLELQGFDVKALSKSGQLICEEAEKLLSSFMFDGIIDEHLFKSIVGAMITKAKAAGGQRPVACVWRNGEFDLAVQAEGHRAPGRALESSDPRALRASVMRLRFGGYKTRCFPPLTIDVSFARASLIFLSLPPARVFTRCNASFGPAS